jgi:hypothetical protein
MNVRLRSTWGTALGLMLLLAAGCSGQLVDALPDTDIVFQSMYDGSKVNTLGFVDADGSSLTYVRIRGFRGGTLGFPVWTAKGDYLVFRALPWVGYAGDLYAIGPDRRLQSYPTEELAFGYDGAAITEDGRRFVIHEARGPDGLEHLYLVATESGEIEETLVTEPKRRASVEVGTSALHRASLVYAHNELVNDETRGSLIVLDLDTGEETSLVTAESIRKPAVSPDGRLVAYTAADGIYVVNVADRRSRRIVSTAVRRVRHDLSTWDLAPPAASWSPDSRWLVYHRCTLPADEFCGSLTDYSIFKVNIETGEEILLVEQGLYPYWRARKD